MTPEERHFLEQSATSVEVLARALDASRARVAELEGLVDEARALLGKVEWNAENDEGSYCPACGDYRDPDPREQPAGRSGHAPDCPLAAWLAKTAPKEADHG